MISLLIAGIEGLHNLLTQHHFGRKGFGGDDRREIERDDIGRRDIERRQFPSQREVSTAVASFAATCF